MLALIHRPCAPAVPQVLHRRLRRPLLRRDLLASRSCVQQRDDGAERRHSPGARWHGAVILLQADCTFPLQADFVGASLLKRYSYSTTVVVGGDGPQEIDIVLTPYSGESGNAFMPESSPLTRPPRSPARAQAIPTSTSSSELRRASRRRPRSTTIRRRGAAAPTGLPFSTRTRRSGRARASRRPRRPGTAACLLEYT